MIDSPLPAGTKIRVLTTIENGQTHHELVKESYMLATVEEFILAGHRQGLFIAPEKAEPDITAARGCITRALKVVDEWLRKFPENDTSNECMALCEVEQEIQDITHHLNKILPEGKSNVTG